jgi:hypothetical protein
MGGIGSGRRRQNPSISRFHQLDVRQMQRQGALESGTVRSCQWTKDGTVLARAFLSIGASGLTIRYQPLSASGSGSQTTHEVGIVRTVCHFGGGRPWFLCPEPGCARRVAILYGDTRLACRHCRRPTYPIQMVAPISRPLARAQKIRMKLGESVDIGTPFPERPKGMHSWRYTRLAIRAMAAEAQCNADIRDWADQVLAQRG